MRPIPSAIDSQTTTETAAMPPLIAVGADTCSACASAMAADQRYCVECGQRRGAPRLPAFDPPGAQATPPPLDRGRPVAVSAAAGRLHPATTLAAVIGTLLLAMAIGIFIGRSGNDGTSKTATQVVSVISPPTAAGTAPAAAAATPTASGGASTTPAKQAATKKAAPAGPKKPTPAVVKVGSKGTGPGYQNGKFTGNFFGGG